MPHTHLSSRQFNTDWCRRRYHSRRPSNFGNQAHIACHECYNAAHERASGSKPHHQCPTPHSYTGWTPDTRATHHMTSYSSATYDISQYKCMDQIKVGNGQGMHIANKGNAFYPPLKLSNVLHVPHLTKSLLSVQKFTIDNSFFFEFWPTQLICG